jgi:hypothetical protein
VISLTQAACLSKYCAGRLAADLATGQTPSVDPAPFRVLRFEDGSPIVIGPEI